MPCYYDAVFLIIADPSDMRDFMIHAFDSNMLDGTYAFFTFGFIHEALHGHNTWQGEDGRDDDVKIAFEG